MRLPHVRDLDGVDVAVVGIPTDGAVVYRSGARFGPEGIRSASVRLRNYNPLLGVNVTERLSLVDWGDAPTVPGSTAGSLGRSAAALTELVEAGVTTLGLGGDHTSSWRSCEQLPRYTARSDSSSSTLTTTCGTSTSGSSSSTEAS
jgi:agmatinase